MTGMDKKGYGLLGVPVTVVVKGARGVPDSRINIDCMRVSGEGLVTLKDRNVGSSFPEACSPCSNVRLTCPVPVSGPSLAVALLPTLHVQQPKSLDLLSGLHKPCS
jgi:hypothetical protein